MGILKTLGAQEGYARVYNARPLNEAEKLARALQEQGRAVALVYSHQMKYAVYAKV